jgi:ubiquinone/menaquinone biosynthesis C-methylase UbiE
MSFEDSESSRRLESIASMYDTRSEQYDDNNVHVRQARDYLAWADLKPGENVLDLACGTGLVALGAKNLVGSSGRVVGVDISEGMLNVARRKAAAATAAAQQEDDYSVVFVKHDISDLTGLLDDILLPWAPQEPRGSSSHAHNRFDVITCAAALILLEDPVATVRNWKETVLAPRGGRVVTDVQTKNANVVMNVFADIAREVGQTVAWDADRWQSKDALAEVMRQAGLRVDKVFETEPYARRTYKTEQAGEVFDEAVEKEMFRSFGKEDIREKARELFMRRFRDLAARNGRGEIEEETRFWVVVASTS